MQNFRLFAASAAIVIACPASAATIVSQLGSSASFAAPAGGTVINFDDTLPIGFTLANTNASIVQGSTSNYAEPAASDGSRYLAILGNGTSTLQSSTSYDSVSFYIGSIDAYNRIDVLSTTGAVIQSFAGSLFGGSTDGDQDWPFNNRRVTITRAIGDAAIGGIRFASTGNSAEVDNVVFAVPEPVTWGLMLVGFGMVAGAARYRRRGTKVAFG
jgi:hypothetical protein